MPVVHPQVQEILDATAALPEPQSLAEAREAYTEGCLAYVGQGEPVDDVSDVDADGVRVRVYVPKGSGGEALPLVVWIHGGGWILGTIEAHDALCRALCNAAGAVVASVDYRLAPEHPFPEPVEDCERALAWLRRHGPSIGADVSRIAVAGDSAGANLATVLARRAGDVCFQLLVYPVTDGALATESMRGELASEAYGLSRAKMESCWAAYAPGDRRNPDVSPLRAPDVSGLPPALIMLAECDPLIDEGLAYADRLRDAGVPVETTVYDGMAHGFFRWRGAVDAAHDAMEEAGAALRTALASPSAAPAPGR